MERNDEAIAAAAAAESETSLLRRENETLAQQVKELVKAEGKLYRYQEQLDAQLREYQELYQFTRKLNGFRELSEIFKCAADFIVNNLGYDKVVFLSLDDEGCYRAGAWDGYYTPEESDAASRLAIPRSDSLLAPLYAGEPFLICLDTCEDPQLRLFANLMQVTEYLAYPLGAHDLPVALLAVGNAAERLPFCRRISDGELALLGIGNLAGLLSSSIENQVLFAGTTRALEQERLAEAKYRGIFENATEGIFQTTVQGQFLSCNPAMAEILGYDTPEEVMGSVTDIARQLYVEPQERARILSELARGRTVKGCEVEFYRKDGSKRWVRLGVRASFAPDGGISSIDGIMEDVSERKRVEEAIRTLNAELEQRVAERTNELEKASAELQLTHAHMLQQEKMASIGQLAAGVAHEINNPMGFIISNLNTLEKYAARLTGFITVQDDAIESMRRAGGADGVFERVAEQRSTLKVNHVMEDVNQLIAECLEGAGRVKRIVQELKGFARLDEADLKVANLNEGLESTINIVWNEVKFKAELRKELGEIPGTLCNPGQLNQVFMNLLVNAAQAIEKFGVITVRTSAGDGMIRVEISDTGCGIPADRIKRIFDPFYTTKEVGTGTGLGLSIVYDIVKKHDGEIEVKSEPGVGTTFVIRIPVVPE